MNLPNILTLSRIVLAGILVFILKANTRTGYILAVIVFAMASLTDFYDGHIAKKQGLISDFGKIMDPVADKILLLSVFGILAHIRMIAWWMFVVIAVRELVVTGSRLMAFRQGQVLAAERAGKIKTVVQIIAVSSILLYLAIQQAHRIWLTVNEGLMILAVILTVYSGIDYFRSKNEKFYN